MRARSAVGAVGVVLVLVACGSGTTSKTSPTASLPAPIPTTVATTSTTTPPPSTTAPGHTPEQAAALIKRLFDPYAGATVDTAVVGNCFWPQTGRPCPVALTDVMAADLIARLDRAAHEGTGIDPVDCSQNTPTRVSYDKPVQSDGAVRVVVHTFYGDPTALRDHPIRVTVDLATLELTDLACPGPG